MCDLEDTVPLDSPCDGLFVIITWYDLKCFNSEALQTVTQ